MNLTKKLFLIILALTPFSFAINPTSEIDLNILRVFIPVLFFVWLASSLLYGKIFIDTRPRFLFLVLFLILLFFSVFWATEQERAWRKVLFIFSFVPIYLIAFDLFKKGLSKKYFLKIFLITSLIQSALGIFQFLLQFIIGIDPSLRLWRNVSALFLGNNFSENVNQYSSWLVNLNGETILRSFGTFPDPHLFSLFIALSLPVSWYFFKKTKKYTYLMFAFIQILAITLSFSRSSYLAIIIFLAIIFLVEFKKIKKQKKLTWVCFLGFVFLVLILIPNPINKRLASSFNLNEGSNQGRIEMWKEATSLTKENPWTGVGIGNFSYQ
ncbi:MAG: O-antigen ligase family protein, partial [Patescibacteria group bacterium]|nr:O-antigen ligase family protein [Patescibacteria group bacterium]